MITDGQLAAILSALGALAAGTAALVRWAVTRHVLAWDQRVTRVVTALDGLIADQRRVSEALIGLQADVRESREDVHEIRRVIDDTLRPPVGTTSESRRAAAAAVTRTR